jgi:uncharacterized damage-inducible protein DinB
LKDQLHQAWQTNNKINLLFVELISDEDMNKTLSTRGRTIYQQLAHLQNVRVQWLDIVAKDISKKYKPISKDASVDKQVLFEAFESSGKGLEAFIDKSWENEGKVTSFKKGLIPFISYLIAHESHHRGNILLTLKQSGVKIPDELKWGMWDWNKI